jgi:hypothetical protein
MKKIYYLLNIIWGFPMTLIGLITYSVLSCLGYKSKDLGPCKWFTIGKNWGGISLGFVIITDDTPSEHTLDHEFGHSIQNAIFGIFFPFIVALPSAARYWKREFDYKKGKELPPYDSIWFEGQATKLGKMYRPFFNKE